MICRLRVSEAQPDARPSPRSLGRINRVLGLFKEFLLKPPAFLIRLDSLHRLGNCMRPGLLVKFS